MSLHPLEIIKGFDCRASLHTLCHHTDALFTLFHSLNEKDYVRQLATIEVCSTCEKSLSRRSRQWWLHRDKCAITHLISHYRYYNQVIDKDQVFVVALGNNALTVSADLRCWIKFHPIISNARLREQTIFALNVEDNGRDLNSSSNQPGSLGKMSVCALGNAFKETGTSYAAPWISGVVARVRKAFPRTHSA